MGRNIFEGQTEPPPPPEREWTEGELEELQKEVQQAAIHLQNLQRKYLHLRRKSSGSSGSSG